MPDSEDAALVTGTSVWLMACRTAKMLRWRLAPVFDLWQGCLTAKMLRWQVLPVFNCSGEDTMLAGRCGKMLLVQQAPGMLSLVFRSWLDWRLFIDAGMPGQKFCVLRGASTDLRIICFILWLRPGSSSVVLFAVAVGCVGSRPGDLCRSRWPLSLIR